MKNQNIVFITMVSALAFALAPLTWAQPSPQGGPTRANDQPSLELPCPQGANCVQLPVITIHSAGNVARGQTGSFVLTMNSAALGAGMYGMYVNFKVSGTAVAGVDYVAFASPAYIGQSGYATILVKTLADPRASSNSQAYSVVVTLEPGPGYSLGSATSSSSSTSATIWIEPNAISNW